MSDSCERKIDAKLILSIVATGLMSFMGVVIETAMNVTFPTLMKEFNVTTATVQWVTTGYLLMLANVIPASSFLKKRFTTKSLFVTAILFFITGTVLDAAAPTFTLLVAGRLIQGIGTGIALPLMFNIVLEQAPFDKMGLMMGVATLITAMAPAVGPSVGGMIVTSFGWRMIFVFLLPFQVAALIMGLFSIRSAVPAKPKFDWFGYSCLAVCFTGFIYGLGQIGTLGLFSIRVTGSFAVSVVSLILFINRSLHTRMPVINLSVFQNRVFTLSLLVIIFGQFICLGLGFLIPNYSQIVSGKNPFVAGCLLLPGCILGAFLAPFSGKVFDALGPKKPVITGNIAMVVSTLCYSIFAKNLTSLLFIVFYVFFAFGQGTLMGNAMTNGLRHLPNDVNSDGNAVINTLQQLAGAVGTSVVASIVSSSQKILSGNFTAATALGARNAFYLLLVLACAGLCCSLAVFYGGRKNKV